MNRRHIKRLRSTGPAQRGFTLLEMIVSILILGLLAGLVVVGARHVVKLAKSTAVAQQSRTIAEAIVHFKNETGILPPLVRDQQVAGSPVVVTSGTDTYVNVIRFDQGPTDPDTMFLRGMGSPPAPSPTADDPYGASGPDKRYSERSLAIYLMGAMDTPDLYSNRLPLDGVPGLGLYKPYADGHFDIPLSVIKHAKDPANNPSVRAGQTFGPYVNVSSGKVTLSDTDEHHVQLVDPNGVAYRYYRWVHTPPVGSNPPSVRDLNVPLLVGRDATLPAYAGIVVPPDRDVNRNPALKTAAWAVVAAGRNKAFGDEDPATLGRLLGRDLASAPAEVLRQARIEAEADNVIEVGQ